MPGTKSPPAGENGTQCSVYGTLMMIELNDLYVFAQVVDRKGFAAAGRPESLMQSSLAGIVTRFLVGHLAVDREVTNCYVDDVVECEIAC